MTDDAPKCTICDRELTFVQRVESHMYGTGRQFDVPHASIIYRCAAHGFWRITRIPSYPHVPVSPTVSARTHGQVLVVNVIRFYEGDEEFYKPASIAFPVVGRFTTEGEAQAEADRLLQSREHEGTADGSPWKRIDPW